MEIAIPAAALALMYMTANDNDNNDNSQKLSRETFKNNTTSLPNTNTPLINFPVEDKEELKKDIRHYELSNSTVDKYFGTHPEKLQNLDKKKNRHFTSLTGEKITKKGFQHNNMQPFFGSSVKQRIGNYDTAEGILDNMQGAGSQHIRKESLAPLFQPTSNMSWVNGMPNHTDFIQSRMNPSMKMANVKPWESEQVGPGLNQGFTSQPSGGFNSGAAARDRWQPKTVDELRIKTNPKITYGGVTLGGSAGPGRYARGIQGKIEKNRPDTFYINGPERYFTTTGAEKAQTAQAKQPLTHTNRIQSRDYTGGGHNDTAPYVPGKFNMPRRPQLKSDGEYPGVANAQGRGGQGDYGKSGYESLPNARSVTTNNASHLFGNVSSIVQAITAPILDLARPSRKENMVGTIRPTGNAHTTVSQQPTYNPADVAKTTHRETTEANPFGMNVNSTQSGNAYLSNPRRVVEQQRNTTNCSSFNIPGNTQYSSNAPTYDAAYNMHTNPDKELLAAGGGRTRMGNMLGGLYNSYTNIKIDKQDGDRHNGRKNIMNSATNMVIPSSTTLGESSGTTSLPQGMQCERNRPDILNAFRCNPYSQPLNSAA